jgi:hypothetical protein
MAAIQGGLLMSMTLWIQTLEGRDVSDESDDHSIMHELAERLDGACEKLGLTPLSSFFDTTDLEFNIREDESDDDPELDPETGCAYGIDDMQWFDAAAGLKTLQGLRAHVASGAKIPDLDASSSIELLAELDDCIERLQGPAARGGKFNLPVVM